MLILFFFYSRIHYSSYDTYYTKCLENIETTHPSARKEMKDIGISVRRNDQGISQAVDLAGEQTYMKNSKTVSGIVRFLTRKQTVLKWVKNSPYQTKFVEFMKKMTGLDKTSYNPRKCNRPSEIIKSNKIVEDIASVLENHFTTPFEKNFDPESLYNLVSGKPAPVEVRDSLLSCKEEGKLMLHEFERRLDTEGSQLNLFDTVDSNKKKCKTFKSVELKINLKKRSVTKDLSSKGTFLALFS